MIFGWHWRFLSYSSERFAQAFGGFGDEHLIRACRDVLHRRDVAEDSDSINRITIALAANGLRYELLTPDDALLLDRMIPRLFATKTLIDFLELENLTESGATPRMITELIVNAAVDKVEVNVLPCLISGRRHGETRRSLTCNYCMLSVAEVAALLPETKRARALDGPWSPAYTTEMIVENFIRPLQRAVDEGRPVFAVGGAQ